MHDQSCESLYILIEQHMIVGRIALREDGMQRGPMLQQTSKAKGPNAKPVPNVRLVEKKQPAVQAVKEKAMPRRPVTPPARPVPPPAPPPWHAKQDLPVLSVGRNIGKAGIYGYTYTYAHTQAYTHTHIQMYI